MTIEQIRERLQTEEYDFLRTDSRLGRHIILLTLGGSHAYGTSHDGSDVDMRGCALDQRAQILTGERFEQVTDEATDTTVYGFSKLVGLLRNCNPNTIEMLGNRPEHYLYVSPVGRELLDHARLYLMCLDILEQEMIVTYREKEHDLLMDIRNGKYLDGNGR